IFSVAEFVDAEGAAALGGLPTGFEGFRFYNETNGWNKYVAYEIDGDEEVNLTFAFTEEAHVWFINGEEVYRDAGAATAGQTDVIQTVIFNSHNFGQEQDYTYSDVSVIGIAPDVI